MPRIWIRSQWKFNIAGAGITRRAMPMLVSGLALMAGVLASSGAQAQCSGTGTQTFPFGLGGGLNALTSTIATVNTAFLINGTPFVSDPPANGPDQQGGGVWARAVGGSVETKADSSFNGTMGVPYTFPPATVTANASCQTKVQQDFGGFQAGHDIALLNAGGAGVNWHFGVLAGYIGTNFHDETGTMKGNFDVPFAGFYSTFSKGNFFADAQTRFDYYQAELTDSANGIGNERLDARGYSVTANMGYRFALGGNWTAEPSVGGVYSLTQADLFAVAGVFDPTLVVPGQPFPGGFTTLPGAVQIHGIESELGRASIKVGTSAALANGIVAYPFATATVYHEFAGNVTASIGQTGIATPGGLPTGANISTSRVGTYAQFGAGSAFQLADSGWLSYLRADFRTGENIQGVAINAGLRYQLNSGAPSLKDGGSLKDSSAADYSWTGPYVGVSAGATWGETRWNSYGVSSNADNAGYLAGGQIGYNYQVGHFVWGVEGSVGQSNARGVTGCPGLVTDPFVGCQDNVYMLGSVTGKLGYSYGRALFYGKYGWAFGEVNAGMRVNDPNQTSSYLPQSTTNWEAGTAVGAGMEFALTDSWSARAEYMHYEFKGKTFTTDGYGDQSNIGAQNNAVTIGINYHLGRGGDTDAGGSDAPLK